MPAGRPKGAKNKPKGTGRKDTRTDMQKVLQVTMQRAARNARRARLEAGLSPSDNGCQIVNISQVRTELGRLYVLWRAGGIPKGELETAIRVLREIIYTHREEAELAVMLRPPDAADPAATGLGPYVGFRIIPPPSTPATIDATKEE